MGNTANTNPNIPLILYWAKIRCILRKQQSQGPWISFTISTELKSSFSLVILAFSLPVLEKEDWKTDSPANTTISLFGCRPHSFLSVRMTVAAAGVDEQKLRLSREMLVQSEFQILVWFDTKEVLFKMLLTEDIHSRKVINWTSQTIWGFVYSQLTCTFLWNLASKQHISIGWGVRYHHDFITILSILSTIKKLLMKLVRMFWLVLYPYL